MSNATVILSHDNPVGGRPDLRLAIEQAHAKGLYFEYSGGLGDVINAVITTNTFTKLDKMGPNDKAVIVLLCHNPDAPEMFLHHHLSKQILVLSLGMHDSFDRTYRTRHGLPPQPVFHSGVLEPDPFMPRISESDRKVLESLPEKFVAFSATASNGKGEGRSIPFHVYSDMALACLKRGLAPVFLGKRYAATIVDDHKVSSRHNECDPPEVDGVMSFIDRLSVSGSIECVRRSTASIVCNSAIMHAAWRMRKPTFCVVTDDDWTVYQKHPDLSYHGYAYGFVYPENAGCSQSGYTQSQFSAFLDRTIGK